MKAAISYRDADSSVARVKLLQQCGIRWSELLRLSYWDPTTFTVLDTMHALLLGDFKRHVREVWGMDVCLEDDDYHIAATGSTPLSETEISRAHIVFKTGTNQDMASLSARQIRRVCLDLGMRVDRQRKDGLLGNLLIRVC